MECVPRFGRRQAHKGPDPGQDLAELVAGTVEDSVHRIAPVHLRHLRPRSPMGFMWPISSSPADLRCGAFQGGAKHLFLQDGGDIRADGPSGLGAAGRACLRDEK